MVLASSCEHNLELTSQEIIKGRISAVDKGNPIGRFPSNPIIWVQDATKTIKIGNIPFSHSDYFKVGDTCLVVIQKYKDNE